MSGAVFASQWEFLYATVLVGWHAGQQRWATRVSPTSGAPLLAMWTDQAAATSALAEGYALASTSVRPRIRELPEGVGIAVDPDAESGLWIEPDLVPGLRRLADPFPQGSVVALYDWAELPSDTHAALRQVGERYSFVRSMRVLSFTADESPSFGAVIFDADPSVEAEESIVDAVHAALSATTTTAALGVLAVHVLGTVDLPEDARADVLARPAL